MSEVSPSEGTGPLDALKSEVRAARLAFFQTLGAVSESRPFPDENTFPRASQPWRSIDMGELTWFITDGFSDPVGMESDDARRGHGMELFLEFPTQLTLPGTEGVQWALETLMNAARSLDLSRLEATVLRSVRLDRKKLPKECGDVEAGARALMGMTWDDAPRGFELPTGTIRLVAVSLLTGAEAVSIHDFSHRSEGVYADLARFQAGLERDVRANPFWRRRALETTGGKPLPPRVPFTPTSEDDVPPYENEIHDWFDRQRTLARRQIAAAKRPA